MPKNKLPSVAQNMESVLSDSEQKESLVEMTILHEALPKIDCFHRNVKRNSIALIGVEFVLAPLADYWFSHFWSLCGPANTPLRYFFLPLESNPVAIAKGGALFIATLMLCLCAIRYLFEKISPTPKATLETLESIYSNKNSAFLKRELESTHERYMKNAFEITILGITVFISWQVLFSSVFQNDYSFCQNELRNTFFILIALSTMMDSIQALRYLYTLGIRKPSNNFYQIKAPASFHLQCRYTEGHSKKIFLCVCTVKEKYFIFMEKSLEKTNIPFFKNNSLPQFFIPTNALDKTVVEKLNKNIDIIYKEYLSNQEKIASHLPVYNEILTLAFEKKTWRITHMFNDAHLPEVQLILKTSSNFPKTTAFLGEKLSAFIPAGYIRIEHTQIIVSKFFNIPAQTAQEIRQSLFAALQEEKKVQAAKFYTIQPALSIFSDRAKEQSMENSSNSNARWRFRFPKKLLPYLFFTDTFPKKENPTWFNGAVTLEDERITEISNASIQSAQYLFFDFSLIDGNKKIPEKIMRKFQHFLENPRFGEHGYCIKRLVGHSPKLRHVINDKELSVKITAEIKVPGSPSRIFCYPKSADNTKQATLLVAGLYSELGLHAGHTITHTSITSWALDKQSY